jgi:hypothetical protein
MKPLGIVLLFINLLAAGGVAFLATQSWTRRHDQNLAVFKHELALNGVPTEPPAPAVRLETLKAEDNVKVGTREVRLKVLNEHFAGATHGGDFSNIPAGPTLSVVAEVEEMKKVVEGKLAGLPTDAAKIEYLVLGTGGVVRPGPLLLLADDVEERLIYREWLAEAQKPQNVNPAPMPPADLLALARAALDAKFDLAIAKANPEANKQYAEEKRAAKTARDAALNDYMKTTKPADQVGKQAAYLTAERAFWKAVAGKSASLSEADRRRRAASTMAVLDPSEGGQKRTALLVGLKDYHAAIGDRIGRLIAMPARYERQGESELNSFTAVYKQKLTTSQDLDFMLQRQAELTRSFAAQANLSSGADGKGGQVGVRTKHRDDALSRTDDLDKRVKAAAAAQAELEKEIHDLQQLVGARFDELFLLEDQVYKAEKQKAGK